MEQSYEIFSLTKLEANLDYSKSRDVSTTQDQSLMIYKFITTFLFTVAIRNQARQQIPNFVKILRKALKENIKFAVWLLETFSC